MSEYAPTAITKLFNLIDAKIGSAQMSGIIGDRGHTYGYHRARNVLPSGDYSRQLGDDLAGDGWAASALDVKMSSSDMKLVSARLREAMRDNDPRLRALREFGGTLNGSVTFSRDRISGRESFGEWDDTHLWHIHLSIHRRFANDFEALKPIADVIAGVKAPTHAPSSGSTKPIPSKAPAFPLPAGHYFGLITGPARSHGGFNAAERVHVKRIQQRLQALGFAPKAAGWADGKFEQPTKEAVAKWQHAKRAKQTSRFGEVWSDDWKALFA